MLIASNGTQINYEMTGPKGAPVVVFSNSIGTTLELWDGQEAALRARFRVLRYDTRGHGRSPVVDAPATIETLAADLVGVLDGLGVERAYVVGLSLGGMTAQAVASGWPERVHGLVLMATSAFTPLGWAERAALVREKGMGAIVDAVMARWFTPGFLGSSRPGAGEAGVLRERFLAQDPRGYAVCCGAIMGMDLRGAAILAPTLIVAGAEDPATPPVMSEEIRARVAGAEMVVLPRAAHILTIEQAGAANRHLAGFLDGLEGRQVQAGTDAFEAGLANRRAVLGAAHVERSLAGAGAFGMPWQDFVTRMAWGEVWGDPTIPWKTRSMVTMALMVALGREEEFKLHVRPALQNGVTLAEMRALLIQCSVYAGVPAGNGAMRWVREVLGDEADAL